MKSMVVLAFSVLAATTASAGVTGIGSGGPLAWGSVGPSGISTGAGAAGPEGVVKGVGAVGPAVVVSGWGGVGPNGPNVGGLAAWGAGALGHGWGR